jgi:Xaa-Pro aminopeptidase
MADHEMRLAKLRGRIGDLGIDAVLVTQPENRRYLSGFTGSAGALLVTPERALIGTDSRYWEQAERQSPGFELVRLKTRVDENPAELLACAELLQQIGFESAAVSVDQFQTWTRANANVTWVATKDVVESIRIVKDESEVSAIRAAAALADSGFDYLCGVLKPGMTEREAAWKLEVYLRTHGVEALAFETIVASGPNGAMAHHRAGDRVIQHGEPIVVDFGCVVDGYCSDMTRTISLGRADAKYDEVYEVVRRAQQSALDGVHAGSTGIEADALARESIGAAGYGDYFGHGLGHGVGLAIHEAPRASKLAKEALPAGATLTIEPGVYLPGWGGVRIEDLVVVRDDGVEILSQAHKRSII